MILFQESIPHRTLTMNILRENKKFIFFILLAIIGTVFLMQEKTYENDFYKIYSSKTNKKMQEFELSEQLRGIAYSYAQDNNIAPTYKNTMYDCLGYTIYNSPKNSTLNDSLKTCKNDYTQQNAKAEYYNHAWLMRDFSRWDGSYILLESIIKKHIKEKSSYKMLNVSHAMFFDAQRPHMFVSIDYKAANLGGRIYERTMSVKVDAKTKELFDLK